MKVNWYDGGKKPGMPSEIFNREKLFKGVLFRGDKGFLLCDYDYRISDAHQGRHDPVQARPSTRT